MSRLNIPMVDVVIEVSGTFSSKKKVRMSLQEYDEYALMGHDADADIVDMYIDHRDVEIDAYGAVVESMKIITDNNTGKEGRR